VSYFRKYFRFFQEILIFRIRNENPQDPGSSARANWYILKFLTENWGEKNARGNGILPVKQRGWHFVCKYSWTLGNSTRKCCNAIMSLYREWTSAQSLWIESHCRNLLGTWLSFVRNRYYLRQASHLGTARITTAAFYLSARKRLGQASPPDAAHPSANLPRCAAANTLQCAQSLLLAPILSLGYIWQYYRVRKNVWLIMTIVI
jgi:hypothetical protein